MPDNEGEPRLLQIRKYPNRRLYDTTRSRHIGHDELFDLISRGYDVTVTDSATGRDITAAVLMQLILERQSDKLAIFPAAILHQVIRTQRQFLGGVFEQFFRQTAEAQRAAQEQWARLIEGMMGRRPGGPPGPVEWTRALLDAFAGTRRSESPGTPEGAADAGAPTDPAKGLEELRRRIEELSRQVERLSASQREERQG